jgi:hypothetical protein
MKITKWLLLVSLTVGLSSSSFFLADYFNDLITTNKVTLNELAYAQSSGLVQAYYYQRSMQNTGSSAWIKTSSQLAKTDKKIAAELAKYYFQQAKLLTTEITDIKKAVFWSQQAINLGEDSSRIILAKYYVDQGKYALALSLLTENLFIKENEDVVALRAEIAVLQGDITEIKRLEPLLARSPLGLEILKQLTQYQVFPLAGNKPYQNSHKQCLADIQMFATNLADLTYLQQLITQVVKYPTGKYFCFNSVRYIALNQLDCQHKNKEVITCDESIWQAYAPTIKAKYLGVLLPQGGANVNSGVLYLDSKDTVDVFSHELAHLLGFVDEYPLPKNHAKCAQTQEKVFAHNIAVLPRLFSGERLKVRAKILQQVAWRDHILPTTPVMEEVSGRWHVGTPKAYQDKVGLHYSETCAKQWKGSSTEQVVFNAFKPLFKATKLRYFELDFPQQYQSIFASNNRQFLMPSFHYNIALALQKKAKISQAEYWFKQASLQSKSYH